MRIEEDIKLDFNDVLIRPKRSTLRSRKDVDLEREYEFKHSGYKWKGIPLMAANMDTTGTIDMSYELSKFHMITCLHKFVSDEDINSGSGIFPAFTSISIGAKDEDLERLGRLNLEYTNFITVDVANGYGSYFDSFIRKVRAKYPTKTIIAGNVVTGEMTEQLILSGADIVKVGIGPGSACTTRLKTGVGYPQLSAIIECADAAHGLGAHIIADGGCTTPADIAKAYGAGADFVMLGGMLAGHDESGGELVTEWESAGYEWVEGSVQKTYQEKSYKLFYGMSSDTAQNTHYGEQKEYRASEGRTVKVPYKGKVATTLQEILGGLRSTCTYVGAPSLKQLSKCTTFIKVNNTHNRVFIDKEI